MKKATIKIVGRAHGAHSLTLEMAYVTKEGSRFAVGRVRRGDKTFGVYHIKSGAAVSSAFPHPALRTLKPALEIIERWEKEISDDEWRPFDALEFGGSLPVGAATTQTVRKLRAIAHGTI